jgi:L-fuconolactonase
LRIDSHHSFTSRYPLEHLGSILKRNRFEGSVLVVEAALQSYPEFVKGVILPFDPRCLESYQRHPQFRGVYQQFETAIPDGLAELERRNIPLDAAGGLALIPEIAGRFPALRIVIDHLGAPPDDDWAQALERAAAAPNVWCKLSGVIRFHPSPRPFVQHALRLFGPGRLMFGSNWPADLPEVTWKASLAAFTQAIGAQSIQVREQLLGGTAERFYSLYDSEDVRIQQ